MLIFWLRVCIIIKINKSSDLPDPRSGSGSGRILIWKKDPDPVLAGYLFKKRSGSGRILIWKKDPDPVQAGS